MDDVWLVLGLLLFGSLLFCLCCYKVTNLLYMLYHIDDTEIESLDDTPIVDDGPGAGVTASAVASGDEIKDYRLLNNVAASTGLGCGHLYATDSMPQSLYAHNFFSQSSSSQSRKKPSSVSSLSVGVQCDAFSLSELKGESPFLLRDSRKSLLGSTPSIYRRVDASYRGSSSNNASGYRYQSSTSSLSRKQRGFGETGFSDFARDQSGSSSCYPPCRRHNSSQGFFTSSSHLLRQSKTLMPLSNDTANRPPVPCRYDCTPVVYHPPGVGTPCCLTHGSSNDVINDPGGFILIPPPVDFSANFRKDEEEPSGSDSNDEDSDDEEEEGDLLIMDRSSSINPYSNSPTSLC